MKKGFTLVEILITLGIVGVVAVLTLPNLIKNHQKRVLVTQLQRTYNTITNAMPAYLDEVHATKLFDTDAFNANRNPDDVSKLVEFVQNNFKTSKICTADTTGGTEACYGSEYRGLNGDEQGGFGGDVCTILKTNATICFQQMGEVTDFPYVFIDVNGPQGPNVWGRDAYQLEFNHTGDMAETFDSISSEFSADNPDPETGDTGSHNSSVNCGKMEGIYSGGCFNKIVEDGWKMDY